MPEIDVPQSEPIFSCGVCQKAWTTKAEFEDHCKYEPQKHLQKGHAPCIYCQKEVTFKALPFTKDTEPTPAICDACFEAVVKPAIAAKEANG